MNREACRDLLLVTGGRTIIQAAEAVNGETSTWVYHMQLSFNQTPTTKRPAITVGPIAKEFAFCN